MKVALVLFAATVGLSFGVAGMSRAVGENDPEILVSRTDGYASFIVDLCEDSAGFGVSGMPQTGGSRIIHVENERGDSVEIVYNRLHEGVGDFVRADPCCVCGAALGTWIPPQCWVNSFPCCCEGTIQPSGAIYCECSKGACSNPVVSASHLKGSVE